jgi:hypothetical protein
MPPILLAKKILELDEADLITLLRKLEMEERELYHLLIEKLEDL